VESDTSVVHIVHGAGKHGSEILTTSRKDHEVSLECFIGYLNSDVTERLVIQQLLQIVYELWTVAERMGNYNNMKL
jgi:hypothetical protein